MMAPVAPAAASSPAADQAAASGLTAGELASMIFAVDLLDNTAEATTDAALNAADTLTFGDWFDTRAVEHWAEQLASMIGDFELEGARDADGAMADLVSIVSGKPFRPIGVRLRKIPQS